MPYNSFENYPMSWKPKLVRGKGPLYRSLSHQLEEDIKNGTLLPGTKLPPQRELADYLDINLSTVVRAFRICSEKGLLSGNVGRGTYVAFDVATRVSSSSPAENADERIDLGVMMPEKVPQGQIQKLLREMLTEDDYGRFFQYSIHVDAWQRKAAGSLLERVGCPVRDDMICFAAGAQNALSAIFAGFFRPGDYIGVDPLVYPGVKSIASLFGVRLVELAQENGEISEAGLLYAVKNTGIKAVYIMPDCHNPTTHTMSESCRRMLARVAGEKDLTIIEDSMDRLLQTERMPSVYSLAPDRTFYVLSLSKAVNPALRLAFVAPPASGAPMLENALYNLNLSQSALLLEISSRLIVSGQLEDVLRERRNGLEVRNSITDSILKGYDLCGTPYSLGRWLIFPEGVSVSGMDFERMSMERGVSVYGGERFVVGREAPVRAARLAICAPDTTESLAKGLSILRGLLESLENG